MATNEQIQQAIQAASNAGAATGYARALEDVVGNLAQMEATWTSERAASEDEPTSASLTALLGYIQTSAAIRENIAVEAERRKEQATQLAQAANALAVAALGSTDWKVPLVRRAIESMHLRPLLLQALGGAESRRPGQ